MLASFVDENTASSSNATANPSSSSAFLPALPASLAAPATAQVPAAVSSTANLAIGVNDGNQLLRGFIPGGTFTNCQFTFNINSGPTSNE